MEENKRKLVVEVSIRTVHFDGDYCEAPKDKDGDYVGDDEWVCDFYNDCDGNADSCDRHKRELDVDENCRVKRCAECKRECP